MKSTIRCCISCILPCGALDVIRIVHVNGRVEEITGTIYAAEILKAHPKHILKKPTTKPLCEDMEPATTHHRPTIVVVPPDAQLQRGKIYFLIPVIDSSKKNKTSSKLLSTTASSPSVASDGSSSTARRKRREQHAKQQKMIRSGSYNSNDGSKALLTDDDKYLSEILSTEKVSSHRERRRGRVAVWRPHLESITETLSEATSSDQ